MKLTIQIPDDTRSLQISGIRSNGRELLLVGDSMRDDIYEGAEIHALWGKEESPDEP